MVSQELLDTLNASRLSAIRCSKAATEAVAAARHTESMAEATVATATAAHIIAKYEKAREDREAAATRRSRSPSRSRTHSLPRHFRMATPAGIMPTYPFTPRGIPSTPAVPSESFTPRGSAIPSESSTPPPPPPLDP